MYERYFGFARAPFRSLETGAGLCRAASFERAIEALRNTAAPLAVLTGRRGAGKTTVLEHLASNPGPDATYGLMRAAASARGSVARRILTAFAWPMPAGHGPELDEAIATGIAAEAAENRTAVLLVDDADALTAEEIAALKAYSGTLDRQPDGRSALGLVFAGLPGLMAEDVLGDAPRVTLDPLSAAECTTYVRYRMAYAGGDGIFSADALELVYDLSDGIPAAINRLCDLALTAAMATGRRDVDARLIEALIDADRTHPGFIEQTLRDLAGARAEKIVRVPDAGTEPRPALRRLKAEARPPARALYIADREHMDAAIAAVIDGGQDDRPAPAPAPVMALPVAVDAPVRSAAPTPVSARFSHITGLTTAAAAAALAVAVVWMSGESSPPLETAAAPQLLALPSGADAVVPPLALARAEPDAPAPDVRRAPPEPASGPDLENFALYLNPHASGYAMPAPRPYRLADGDTFRIAGRVMASLHLIQPQHRAAWPGVAPAEPLAVPRPGTEPARAHDPRRLAAPAPLLDADAAAQTASIAPALGRQMALLTPRSRTGSVKTARADTTPIASTAPTSVTLPPARPGTRPDIPVAALVTRAETLPAASRGKLQRTAESRGPSVSLALLSRLGAADWRRSGTTDPLRTPVLDDIPLPAFEAEPLPLSRFAEPEQAAPDTHSRRLVIHHRADDMARARALLAPLRARGFEPELRQVPHAIARSHIRYFYSDDLEGARLVSGIVSGHGGEATALRDFVHHRPSPRPGTLELWLSN